MVRVVRFTGRKQNGDYQQLGKEKGGIVVECVQSFCFARGKESWSLVAQNVNVLNIELGQVIDLHVLYLPSVCGKSLAKE